MLQRHVCLPVLSEVLQCIVFVAGVLPVSILPAGDWARVSTPSRHYFSTYITNMDKHQDSGQCTVLASVSSHVVGNYQTLTYVKSCRYVGLLGHSFPQYWASRSPIVYVVLALDSGNYCSGEQGPTAQHLYFIVCFIWLHWINGSVPLHSRESNIRWQHCTSLICITLFSSIKKIVQYCRYDRLLGLALQSSSSNHLVIILQQSIG